MNQLLNLARKPGTDVTYIVDPAEIVRAAEQIGRVKIERSPREPVYRCEIYFETMAGSRIFAGGTDADFFTAILKAIQEAARLS